MFGWEFPPQISGGLGTACYGLTHSLGQEQVDILFVVPKLHGGETATGTNFISASNIPILQTFAQNGSLPSPSDPASKREFQHHPTQVPSKSSHRRKLRKVEVPSTLAPYRQVQEQYGYDIEQWNYSFSHHQEYRDYPWGERNRMSLAQLSSYSMMSQNAAPQQVRMETVPYSFTGTYGPNLLAEVDRYARVAAEIARQYVFDVIHVHDWMTFPAGIEVKKVSGKPLIVHVHATEYDRSGENGSRDVYAIERRGMEAADRIVTVSNRTKKLAVENYGIPEKKITVVHNGITLRENGSTSSGTWLGAPIVTFLGRITHQKGPMFFVEAARKVHEQFPEAHFVVAGSGDLMPLMIHRIAELRLSSHFHFTGFLKGEDVDRIWSVSSVYVMPSVSEPFGLAPLEAIQAGVPVIISNQAGVAEVMPHAIKVDFWNTAALADAICSILRYKSLHRTLRQNSAREIKTITWDKAAKKITSLYYELSTKP